MAEWIPPKTNWVAGDIPGAGDFNRSEGNILANATTVIPSDNLILALDAERSVAPGTAQEVKSFTLKYSGYYRVTVEIRRRESSDSGQLGAEVAIRIYNTTIADTTYYGTVYATRSWVLWLPRGIPVDVYLQAINQAPRAYLRRLRIYGTVIEGYPTENAVLLD